MRLTEKQFAKIEHLMPTPRRKPEVSNYDFLCALLYIIENGCKWRALPNEYGNWHTIYVRFNRWCKSGVIDRIFETLQEENIVQLHCVACKVPYHIPKDFYGFFLAGQQLQNLALWQVHVFRYLHKALSISKQCLSSK